MCVGGGRRRDEVCKGEGGLGKSAERERLSRMLTCLFTIRMNWIIFQPQGDRDLLLDFESGACGCGLRTDRHAEDSFV